MGAGRKSARWRRRTRRFRTGAASGPGAVNLAALDEWLKREHACDDSLNSVQRVAARGTTTVLIDTLPDLRAQLLDGRIGRPERGWTPTPMSILCHDIYALRMIVQVTGCAHRWAAVPATCRLSGACVALTVTARLAIPARCCRYGLRHVRIDVVSDVSCAGVVDARGYSGTGAAAEMDR